MTPRWLLTAAALAVLAATGITLALPRWLRNGLVLAADRRACELCEAVAAAWDEDVAA